MANWPSLVLLFLGLITMQATAQGRVSDDPARAPEGLSEAARDRLAGYCTRVDVGPGRRVDLFTPTMFRVRSSALPGEAFPLKYEIPFAVGRYESWKAVSFTRSEDDVFVYVTTDALQVRVFKATGDWLVWDAAGGEQLYPSDGPAYGMVRDGYTVFDAASHLMEENEDSRFAHRFYHPGTRRYSTRLEDDALMDQYFVYGPDYASLFRQYNELVGPEPMLRRKSYGFHQTQHLACEGTQAKLLDVVEKFDELEIPLDTVIIDFEWGDGCVGGKGIPWGSKMEWSPSYRTPLEPEAFLTKLRSLDIDTMLIHHNAPRYPGRTKAGWTAHTFDWDEWWGAIETRLAEGVAGTWQDTRQSDVTDHFIYEGLVDRTGLRPVFLGNYDVYENCGWRHEKHPVPTRNIVGARRTPFRWTGDEESTWWEFTFKVEAVTNSQGPMKGISYLATDVKCNDWKLQARWNQFNDFLAVSRTHNQKPWRANDAFLAENFAFQEDNAFAELDRRPRYDTETPEDIETLIRSIRKHRALRYQLIPYLYTAAHENYATGMPILRPMLLAFPDDPKCNADQFPHQYMFGPEILVAPVIDTRFKTQGIYLPAGTDWIDYWSDERYKGGQRIKYDVTDIETLPLFVRSGAILPMQPPALRLSADPPEKLVFAVYPDTDRVGVVEVYEDDGESLAYRQGAYAITRLECRVDGNDLRLRRGEMVGDFRTRPASRDYVFEIHGQPNPPAVVDVAGSGGKLEAEWEHDAERERLTVRLTQPTDGSARIGIKW
ncbi:MAG: TIM-barrel domain-containing protein [Planctomycetota bacterium]